MGQIFWFGSLILLAALLPPSAFGTVAIGLLLVTAATRMMEAGTRGTEVIERLIPRAAERLVPGGRLFIEISPPLNEAVRALVAADGRFELQPTIDDHGRRPRVVVARRA